MRSVVTKILWLAVIGALGYGGFVAYERWWDGDWNALGDRVISFARDTVGNAGEKAKEAGSEAVESVKQEATEAAKSAIASAVGGAIESLGNVIERFGTSVANAPSAAPAPAAEGGTFSIPPPPVALSARVGDELTFVVNRGEHYAADWGDGTNDEGDKAKDANVLIRHAWRAPGDYTVRLTTTLDLEVRTETFPARIYE